MAYFFRSRSSGVQQNPTPSLQVGRRDAAALDMPPTSEEEPLVYPGHELPVSPKLWLVLGLLYGILGDCQRLWRAGAATSVLPAPAGVGGRPGGLHMCRSVHRPPHPLHLLLAAGIVQLILAFTWRWWFGVALGLGVIKTGSSLTGLGWTGGRPAGGASHRGVLPWLQAQHQSRGRTGGLCGSHAELLSCLVHTACAGGRQVRPDAATLGAQLKRALLRVLLWGSAKIQQLLWRLRWLVYGYGVFIALLIAIHLASPDPQPPPAAFPAECPHAKRFGCSRVAEAAIHGARGQQPAYIESGPDFVQVGGGGGWQPAHCRALLACCRTAAAKRVGFLWFQTEGDGSAAGLV